jgi:hypothetical protein
VFCADEFTELPTYPLISLMDNCVSIRKMISHTAAARREAHAHLNALSDGACLLDVMK